MVNTRRSVGRASGAPAKDQTRLRIEKMEAEREERRRAMRERKEQRAKEEQRNIAAGNPGDVDFIGMVRKWREVNSTKAQAHDVTSKHPRICICVRKRPINGKERKKNDHDSVTCLNPEVWIHSAKLRVDGITKYLDHNSFRFDYTFAETVGTDDVYLYSTMPLLDTVCSGTGGRVTVFAYGQTGSGKTFTMNGIQEILCEDLFSQMSKEKGDGSCSLKDTNVTVSFFELYGGYVQDLLNQRKKLKILEDGNGEIVISGLEEFDAKNPTQFLALLEAGQGLRTTHTTEANDSSSRSHAICQIFLRDKETKKLRGKFSLVDLAGSERGTDTKSHNSQRRTESAEINTSLLALKECIRALDMNKNGPKHVPFRASKLTLILKDCFTSANAKTTMIATISPGASAADHSLNTLRYADRIKQQRVADKKIATVTDNAENKKVEPERQRDFHASEQTSKDAAAIDDDDISKIVDEAESVEVSLANTQGLHHPSAVLEEPRTEPESSVTDEAELRGTVQAVFEQEELILNMHMANIQENAELLTEEGKMLQNIQKEDATEEDVGMYAKKLSEILDRKTLLILSLQEKLKVFRSHLKKEQDLSKKVRTLRQY